MGSVFSFLSHGSDYLSFFPPLTLNKQFHWVGCAIRIVLNFFVQTKQQYQLSIYLPVIHSFIHSFIHSSSFLCFFLSYTRFYIYVCMYVCMCLRTSVYMMTRFDGTPFDTVLHPFKTFQLPFQSHIAYIPV